MPTVLVCGGGLAGLTVAHELQRHGFEVRVVEAADEVGGKATSLPGDSHGAPGAYYEHGYHIFPPWYANTREVLRDLGVSLIDFDRWHYIEPMRERTPRISTMNVPSLKRGLGGFFADVRAVLRASPLPLCDTLLYFYFVFDLASEPLSNMRVLDRVSRLGLMRGRWYMTEKIPELEEEHILKASAVPLYEMSGGTAKILSELWLRNREPFLSVLPGELRTTFIQPYASRVLASGVRIDTGTKVVRLNAIEGGRLTSVRVRGSNGVEEDVLADAFVLTTPLEVTRELLTTEAIDIDPDLGNLEHLRTAPMGALHLVLARPIAGLPREHVFFRGGHYGLSFIDNTQNWGLEEQTLSFIASNFLAIQDLPSKDEQYRTLFEEIRQYLPISENDVRCWQLFPHKEERLFINTVASWPNRPDATCGIANVFFAGDWVRSNVDLATMEGAVSSARAAAHAIGECFSSDPAVSIPPPPKAAARYVPLLLRVGVWALAPAAAALWVTPAVRDLPRRIERWWEGILEGWGRRRGVGTSA